MATETARTEELPPDVTEHLTTEDRSGLLRAMLMMRGIEERAMTLYRQGKVPGSFYDGFGQEAVSAGATFTVSNLGMFGIDSFAAVINPPQAAILAVGAISERPVVRDGQTSTAHLMRVNLACDHRILYGADAAEFLAKIREYLEQPLKLAL